MGFLGETFDINDIPEAEKREFEPVPAGWYTATIANAELRDTKAGTEKSVGNSWAKLCAQLAFRNSRTPISFLVEIFLSKSRLGTILIMGPATRSGDLRPLKVRCRQCLHRLRHPLKPLKLLQPLKRLGQNKKEAGGKLPATFQFN